MRITYRLLLLVALSTMPATAILLWNGWDLRRSREAEVAEQARRQALLAASEIRQIVSGVRSLLTAVAEVPAVRRLEPGACMDYLAGLVPRVPYLLSLAAIGRDGRVICRHHPAPEGTDVADRDYFKEALATGDFVVGGYLIGEVANRPALPLALPLVPAEGGEAVGVLAAGLDLAWLGAELRRRALPPGGSVTVADQNGVILAREPLPERFVGTRIPPDFAHLLRAPHPGAIEVTSQDGNRRVLAYVPGTPPTGGLYVSTGLSSSVSFAAVERAAWRSVAMTALGLGIALVAAALAGHRFIQRPVRELAEAANRWRGGDYQVRAVQSVRAGGGEFGELAATFDGMVAAIAGREAALRVSEARLSAAIDCLPFELWVCDRSGRYVLQNSAARRRYGDLLGRRPENVPGLPTEVTAGWAERNARALRGETVRGTWVHADATGKGTRRWYEDLSAPVTSDGEVIGVVGISIDVTEQRGAAERQRLLLRELSHRVKNTLATVQAIAARSLAGGRSMEEGREILVQRLRALGATHDLLTASDWKGADLREIAAAELKPYGQRVEIEGNNLVLVPKAAQTLGLILHELATNAAKHGALGGNSGYVNLSWGIEIAHGDRALTLNWQEHDGPPVTTPDRSGFGRTLVERVAAYELKGEAMLTFAPDGVRYHLRAPAAEVLV